MLAAGIMLGLIVLVILAGPVWHWPSKPSNDGGCWHEYENRVCIKCGARQFVPPRPHK